MKTKISTLIIGCMMPILANAQPILTKNEFYHVGDIISMTKCDATTISAGAPGANVTWDFSAATSSGGIATTKVLANTSSMFLTSNLMVSLPDGSTEYLQANNTDSYVDAIVSSSSVTTYYNHYDLSRRPIAYNTSFVDTYKMNITAPATTGTGVVTETGDGYGTLKLPTGTFNNVMRVYRHITEKDSVSGALSGFYNVSSYLWFDTIHTAPLFRIDSISDVTGNTQLAMYLTAPTSVKNIIANNSDAKAFIAGNKLQVAGTFVQGNNYHVVMYDIIGSKILTAEFAGGAQIMQFSLSNSIVPGIYVVNVADETDGSAPVNIKVIRQ